MASSAIPLATETASAASERVELRGFPQLEHWMALPSDRAREIYGRGMNNPHAFWTLNRRYVAAIGKCPPPALTPPAQRVAGDLLANGIAFAEFSEFFEPRIFESVSDVFYRYLEEFQRRPPPVKKKGKGLYLDTIQKGHTFLPNDPVSAFLSEPMFAAIAAAYMGMVPRFAGTSFWRTRVGPGSERLYSQNWHRDYNDRMLVKVFLYLTAVGAQEGCLEYLTGSHESGPLGDVFDRIGPDGLRAYPDAVAVEAAVAGRPVVNLDAVPPERRSGGTAPWHGTPTVVRGIVPKASLVFADTFGLHRGGFVESGHRDAIMITYCTNFNVHPPHFAVTRGFAETLTPFQRMSFGVR
jgi:hypothetical protein